MENEKIEIVDKPELINDAQVPGIKDRKMGGTAEDVEGKKMQVVEMKRRPG